LRIIISGMADVLAQLRQPLAARRAAGLSFHAAWPEAVRVALRCERKMAGAT
jgi:hypothetical protein